MKSTMLLLAFGMLALRVSAEPPPREAKPPLTDYETLRTADCFSIGAINGHAIPQEEKALRRILQTPTAAEDCRKLISGATPAGQVYGLLGLKLLKDASYSTVAARFRISRVEIYVTQDCIMDQRPIFLVVRAIDQGRIK